MNTKINTTHPAQADDHGIVHDDAKRYHLIPASMGLPRAGISLEESLGLADALEDEAIVQKLGAQR